MISLPTRRASLYLALLPVCLGIFIAADDQTVVVTVLPQIMLDMKVQVNELDRASWTITGYLLGYVSAMPLLGRMSDVWGHRLFFVLSMAAFMVGSAAVAMTRGLEWLVAARVFQALGAGALVPISIAIVGDLFPPERRGLPLGLIGASAEAGGVIGPLWGGLIIKYLSWPWVFWINLPLGAIVLALVLLLVGPSPRYPVRVDYLGGLLLVTSLSALTLGLARLDAPDGLMAIYLAVSAGALWGFMLRQRRAREPLVPLAMFRLRAVSSANATHLLVGGALIIGMVTVPLMTNTVMALPPIEGGLRLVRMTAAIPVGAVLGGMACQRWDYRIPTVAGLLLAALGYYLMSGWELDVADPAMSVHLVVAGLGFGLVIAPIALAATNEVGAGHRGTAAAVVTAMRMVGMTVGLAALSAWGVGRFEDLVAGVPSPLPMPGETPEQFAERLAEIQARVTGAGMTLFKEFFLVASVTCLAALLPALNMVARRRK